mmetsp:Transcript_38719/g.54031  ORF Transcript_38719/g.54031 Transcript_38719/m.54031 type:complete len:235 (-) Transcript_38719:517-1221(-)
MLLKVLEDSFLEDSLASLSLLSAPFSPSTDFFLLNGLTFPMPPEMAVTPELPSLPTLPMPAAAAPVTALAPPAAAPPTALVVLAPTAPTLPTPAPTAPTPLPTRPAPAEPTPPMAPTLEPIMPFFLAFSATTGASRASPSGCSRTISRYLGWIHWSLNMPMNMSLIAPLRPGTRLITSGPTEIGLTVTSISGRSKKETRICERKGSRGISHAVTRDRALNCGSFTRTGTRAGLV